MFTQTGGTKNFLERIQYKNIVCIGYGTSWYTGLVILTGCSRSGIAHSEVAKRLQTVVGNCYAIPVT